MTNDSIDLGADLLEAMKEVAAHRRGELSLPGRHVEAMPAARVKSIRKSVAKSPKEFERRFHVPARTLEGWEQGKRVDAPAAALLRVIERDPEAVERALAAG